MSTDVESLQPVPRQRSRCMDVFLLGSVITLFVLVLSGTALGFWVVKDLRAEMVSRYPKHDASMSASISGFPPNLHDSFKVQNFAYLRPTKSELKNASMLWESMPYGTGTTVGSSYSYNQNNAVLKVKKEGTFFLYTQLNLTCISSCSSGTLSITFHGNKKNELLTCSVQLPANQTHPQVNKCWTVIPRLEKDSQLMASMHGSVNLAGWILDLNHSGFGMFMVD